MDVERVDQAWEDRFEDVVDGLRIPFPGRASLIRNKRASGRPRDLGEGLARRTPRRNPAAKLRRAGWERHA